jgi:branched-chain amino acid transport system permease protein
LYPVLGRVHVRAACARACISASGPVRETGLTGRARVGTAAAIERAIGIAVVVVAALGPFIFSDFFAHTLLTQVFWYGIAAASVIFLFGYGGMISLAQVSLYGIAGFVLGNAVTTGGAKGQHFGLDPWLGVVLAVAITVLIGLLLGALSSRSFGIYFLMLTLTFAVLVNYFFGQVTIFGGFSGVSGIQLHTPGVIGNPNLHPDRLYYVALVTAILVYALIRYIVRTPFGLALQGIRDDPLRMSSLGYNVALHRMLAFGFGAFIASLAGVIFVWWNDHVDPASMDLSAVIDLLVIAVIGGLSRLEGAWLGAFVFVILNDYLRSVPGLGHVGISPERFHTAIGIVFLVIVLLSPGGLMGIWETLRNRVWQPGPSAAEAVSDAREPEGDGRPGLGEPT